MCVCVCKWADIVSYILSVKDTAGMSVSKNFEMFFCTFFFLAVLCKSLFLQLFYLVTTLCLSIHLSIIPFTAAIQFHLFSPPSSPSPPSSLPSICPSIHPATHPFIYPAGAPISPTKYKIRYETYLQGQYYALLRVSSCEHLWGSTTKHNRNQNMVFDDMSAVGDIGNSKRNLNVSLKMEVVELTSWKEPTKTILFLPQPSRQL